MLATKRKQTGPRGPHLGLRARSARGASLLATLLTLGGAPALAAEVWKDGPWAVEASGFVKPYASWLRMQNSLHQGTEAMARAVEEARSLLPPDLAARLPATTALPLQVGVTTHTLRVGAKATWTDALELEVAWQAAFVVASSPAFAGAGSSTYLGASLVTPQRRLVDFEPFLVDEGGLRVQHNLDRLALTWRSEHVTVVVGRQVLSWGTGRFWNPTDLISPFAPTDVDREVRRGADAARVSIGLGATSQLDVLWLPQRLARDMGGVLRARTNLWGWDLSATVGKYVGDLVAGADFAGDLGPLGAHGEAAWTMPLVGLGTSGPVRVEGDFVRALVGLDWRPHEALVLAAEYTFNGFGATNAAGLLEVLRSDRVVRGEVFGAERHYLGLGATWMATDLLTVSLSAIVNLVDPSAMVVPALEYSFEQHVLVRAGGYVPLGAGLDVSLLRGLTGADVLGNSAAWRAATSTLGARSEYGLSPFGAFVQVGVYLP